MKKPKRIKSDVKISTFEYLNIKMFENENYLKLYY